MHDTSSRLGRRPAFVGLVALTALLAACSDDDAVGDGLGGSAGTAGASAAGNAGSSNAGSAGSANAGSGGSANAGSANAGSGGAAGGGGAAGTAGAGGSDGAGDPDAGGPVGFTLSSPAFEDNPDCGAEEPDACDLFPDENTGLGAAANVSPELDWSGAPAGTQTFAIALHDLAFLQNGDPFTHWVMWNIPGTATGLPAELPTGAEPGVPSAATRQVSFRADNGYAGSGACGNVYEFVLYALDSDDFIPDDPDDPDAVQLALQQTEAQLGTATLRARSDPNGPSCGND